MCPRPLPNWIINHTLKISPNFLGSVSFSIIIRMATRESTLFYFLVDYVWYRVCCKWNYFHVFLVSLSMAMDSLYWIFCIEICCNWVVRSALAEYGVMISMLCFWSNRLWNKICFFRGQGGRHGTVKMKTEGKLADIFQYGGSQHERRNKLKCFTNCWLNWVTVELTPKSWVSPWTSKELVSGFQFKEVSRMKVSKAQLLFSMKTNASSKVLISITVVTRLETSGSYTFLCLQANPLSPDNSVPFRCFTSGFPFHFQCNHPNSFYLDCC